jgi:hypothetical protein
MRRFPSRSAMQESDPVNAPARDHHTIEGFAGNAEDEQ